MAGIVPSGSELREHPARRPAVRQVLARGRRRELSVRDNCNARFRILVWGMKCLSETERKSKRKRKKRAGITTKVVREQCLASTAGV